MKTFRLFAHRTKPATYLILDKKAAKEISHEEKEEYFQIDEGTHPFLLNKVKKLISHVGSNNNEQE